MGTCGGYFCRAVFLNFGFRCTKYLNNRLVTMGKTQSSDFENQLVALLPRLRRFAYVLTSNKDEADELVQAACERALSRRHQWQDGTRLDSWMFRIISTIRIDSTRSKRSTSSHIPIDKEYSGSDNSNSAHGCEARVLLHQVLAAMNRLSDIDRAILALVCIEGLSYKDASKILEIPIGTVMSRLARARKRLHQLVYAGNSLRT